MVVVAGPKRRRESATSASPKCRGPLSDQRLPASQEAPEAATGRCARAALRAPAYEHPQRYLIFGRPATTEQHPPSFAEDDRAGKKRRRFGDG
jgi:hypothetical protein